MDERFQDGKLHFPTREQAEAFGRRMSGGPYTLASIEFPADIVNGSYCYTPSMEGSAFFIEAADLSTSSNIQTYRTIS